MCFKALFRSIGGSDHNTVATSRKTKVLKAGHNIVYKWSYNTCNSDSYVRDVYDTCWSVGCNEERPLKPLATLGGVFSFFGKKRSRFKRDILSGQDARICI